MTTTKAKLCHNPNCRSTGEHKAIHAKGLCQRCYKAKWRQKRATAQVELVAIEGESESASALRHYLSRQTASRRRKIVLELLDQGHDLGGICERFLEDADLRREHAINMIVGQQIVKVRADNTDRYVHSYAH